MRVVLPPVRFSPADAANLPPTTCDRAGERTRSMATHRHQQFVAFRLNARAVKARQESGSAHGIGSIADARPVIR